MMLFRQCVAFTSVHITKPFIKHNKEVSDPIHPIRNKVEYNNTHVDFKAKLTRAFYVTVFVQSTLTQVDCLMDVINEVTAC